MARALTATLVLRGASCVRRSARTGTRRGPRLGVLATTLAITLTAVACGGGGGGGSGSTPPDRGGSTASGAGSGPPAEATDAGCRPARPGAPNDTEGPQVFPFGGQEREHLLAVPAGDDGDGTGARPLVVDLHGHGGRMARHDRNTGLSREGRARGAIVVTPQALGEPARWNFDRRPGGPDDYGYVLALVADLLEREQLCIDPDRVYVAGSSNGAAFAGLLVCEEPEVFAAVAMVIATTPSTCPAGVTPSRISVRGTADRTPDATGMVEADAERHGCARPPETESPAEGVERRTYHACAGGAEMALVTIQGGDHSWPGSPQADRPGNSPAARAFPATRTILDFFAGHPRSRS